MIKKQQLVHYLKKEDVVEGNIVPIYYKEQLEGFANLVNPEGDKTSFMVASNKDEDGPIYVKQRWLIKWATLDDIPNYLSTPQQWTQRSLSGKLTHRYISHLECTSWEQYSYRYGGLRDIKYNSRGSDIGMDDSNMIV